jgi:hypothetical protein
MMKRTRRNPHLIYREGSNKRKREIGHTRRDEKALRVSMKSRTPTLIGNLPTLGLTIKNKSALMMTMTRMMIRMITMMKINHPTTSHLTVLLQRTTVGLDTEGIKSRKDRRVSSIKRR